jgi:hypothetical protein
VKAVFSVAINVAVDVDETGRFFVHGRPVSRWIRRNMLAGDERHLGQRIEFLNGPDEVFLMFSASVQPVFVYTKCPRVGHGMSRPVCRKRLDMRRDARSDAAARISKLFLKHKPSQSLN